MTGVGCSTQYDWHKSTIRVRVFAVPSKLIQAALPPTNWYTLGDIISRGIIQFARVFDSGPPYILTRKKVRAGCVSLVHTRVSPTVFACADLPRARGRRAVQSDIVSLFGGHDVPPPVPPPSRPTALARRTLHAEEGGESEAYRHQRDRDSVRPFPLHCEGSVCGGAVRGVVAPVCV